MVNLLSMSFNGVMLANEKKYSSRQAQKPLTPSFQFRNRSKNSRGMHRHEPHRNGSRHYRGQRLFDLTTYHELVSALTRIVEGAATCNNYGHVHGDVQDKLQLAQRYANAGHYFKQSRIARMGQEEVRAELRRYVFC